MKRRFSVVTVLCIVVAVMSSGLVAHGEQPLPAGDKVIVRAYYGDPALGTKVLISFEGQLLETNYEEGYHVLEVGQAEIDLLTGAGLRVVEDKEWTPPPVHDLLAPPEGIATIPSYPCYRTVEETFAAADLLVQNHPTLAAWADAGDSWQKTAGLGGYDMKVLILSNSAVPGPKPKLFVTGAIHAREYATAELATRFAEYLVNNYGVVADATWILDHHEVHLMLQSNPDGRKKAETGLSWRKNTNQNYCGATSNYRGADLNRNFAFQWACCGGSSGSPCDLTYRGPSAASEPETQAVQAYLNAIFPDQRGSGLGDPAPEDATGVYIDLHSYGQLVLWPWGFTSNTAPNAAALQTLGRKFAYWNNHTPQQAIGLYPTDGTTDDHAYGILGIAAYCFEVGTSFFQSCSYFENTLMPANMPALIYAAKVARTPYLTASGPDAANLAVTPNPVPPGTPANLTATIDDTHFNNSNGTEPTQNIAAAEYYVDVPPWSTGAVAHPMAASDGSLNAKTENVTAAVDTAGLSDGRHTIFVRGQDAGGRWGAVTAVFLTVSASANLPPVAAFTYNCTGLSCDFDASASSDPDGTVEGWVWNFGDGNSGSGQTVSHAYPAGGSYTVVLTVTDDDGATDTDTQSVPVSGGSATLVYAGSTTDGTAGGVAFADEDILAWNTATSSWSMLFDGSDVGLGSNSSQDVDAFEYLADGSLLISLVGDTTITGLGSVDDSDLVKFVPASLGPTTAGTFSYYFDGSDVGLSTSSEDVDAVEELPDGRLLFSTAGSFTVTGASGADEDLIAFMPTQLGPTTSGTWAIYFDGSDVGLTATSENVNGLWVHDGTGDLYLSTVGAFSVTGASGDGADIFVCHPTQIGPTTACTFGPGLYWDGSANGFAGEDTDGVTVVPGN